MKERTKTVLAVLAVAAIVVFAALDSLRGGGSGDGSSPSASGPASTLRTSSSPSGPVPPLPRDALSGSLWYADADCRIVRVDLATLVRRRVTPAGGYCRFWLSPDGRYLAMDAGRPSAPRQKLELLDLRSRRLTTPFAHADLGLAPPAWSADSRRLIVCDSDRSGGQLDSLDVRSGRVSRLRRGACYPGFAGGRLVWRDARRGTAVAGGRSIAGIRMLRRLLHQAVTMGPGLAAQAETVAVPATTVQVAGGPEPDTIIVFLSPGGRVRGSWDTGTQASEIGLTGGGRFALAWRPGQAVVYDRRRRRRFDQSLQTATASPDGRTLALATPLAVVFTDVASGEERFALHGQATWLAWTR